jgi:hypothetical protein
VEGGEATPERSCLSLGHCSHSDIEFTREAPLAVDLYLRLFSWPFRGQETCLGSTLRRSQAVLVLWPRIGEVGRFSSERSGYLPTLTVRFLVCRQAPLGRPPCSKRPLPGERKISQGNTTLSYLLCNSDRDFEVTLLVFASARRMSEPYRESLLFGLGDSEEGDQRNGVSRHSSTTER